MDLWSRRSKLTSLNPKADGIGLHAIFTEKVEGTEEVDKILATKEAGFWPLSPAARSENYAWSAARVERGAFTFSSLGSLFWQMSPPNFPGIIGRRWYLRSALVGWRWLKPTTQIHCSDEGVKGKSEWEDNVAKCSWMCTWIEDPSTVSIFLSFS